MWQMQVDDFNIVQMHMYVGLKIIRLKNWPFQPFFCHE